MTGPEPSADGGQQPAVWLDDAPVDPAWAAPATPDGQRQRTRRRRLLGVGVPALIVIVLVAGVWALGGFAQRNDTATVVPAGTTFVDGPLEFTFDRATVQETDGYGRYKRIQKVVVIGTVRNTWNQALSPGGDWFLARGENPTDVQTGKSAGIGGPDQFDAPDSITPGLPAVPIRVNFEFPPTFQAGHTIFFAARSLTYGTHSYFSSEDSKFWDKGGSGIYRMMLPLTRLATQSS